MKLINEKEIVEGCKLQKGKWQKMLFDATVDYMRAVCMRYTNDPDTSDDIMQEGYIKVFYKIEHFEWEKPGSLFFWIKRIMTNTAIDAYRKQTSQQTETLNNHPEHAMEEEESHLESFADTDFEKEKISIQAIYNAEISESELIQAVGRLPQPFRLTFNLFAIEGLKHKEIAEMLNIPIKTSTTRVLRAKKLLQNIIAEICAEKITSIA